MSDPDEQRLAAAFDPERFRRTGHDFVDRLADYLTAAQKRTGPSVLRWTDPEQLVEQLPGFEEGPSSEPERVLEDLIDASLRLHDPRTMGHQDGVALPTAALGAFAASFLNTDPSVYETGPGAVAIEVQLLRWMASELGLPDSAGGIFTSGGSLGNFTALLAARQAHAGFDAWKNGQGTGPPLAVLVSEETHYCVNRAVQMMGWGAEGAVAVPVDASFRMRADALPAALARVNESGRRVIAVVGSACTTATSSFDPLNEIASFCAENELWFHVDGAHGASAALSPRYRHLVSGIERADSVVWDGHKMMMVPSLVTAVLFRDARHSYGTFRQEATYLFEDRPDEEWYNPGNRTVECTKGAVAARLYFALRTHGAGIFRDYVTRCFDLAREFALRVEAASDFELAVKPEGNIVCFRHVPSGAGDLDRLQRRLRQHMLRHGPYYITQAELGGNVWLRCSLMNPLTNADDLEGVLETVRGYAADGLGSGSDDPTGD